MGLRINHNISALEALRNLRQSDNSQAKSLERLSTGLRINRASDDPSGLVISEQLRAQVASVQQSIKNAQNDMNLLNTTEAALNEVNSLLVGIRESIIFAMNRGASSDEQVAAEQRSVDRAIQAIDRIAVTTRFASRSLLNGASDFQVTGVHDLIDDLKVRSVRFGNNQTSIQFTVKIDDLASRATLRIASAGTGGGTLSAFSNANRLSASTVIASSASASAASGTQQVVQMRVTGTLGSEDIFLASGATIQDFMDAVNAVTNATGVFASSSPAVTNPGGVPIVGASGFSYALYSTGFGKNQRISIENLTASGSTVKLVNAFNTSGIDGYNVGVVSQGFFLSDSGDDLAARVDGAVVVANGFTISVTSNFLDADLQLSERLHSIAKLGAQASSIIGSLATSGLSFRVHNNANSGLTFQLNSEATSIDRISIGVSSMRAASLGLKVERENLASGAASNQTEPAGGFLTSLRSGGDNSLKSNANNALQIVDAAIAEVSEQRSFLGSIYRNTLESAVRSLNVTAQNLTASESSIRDLDFASETTTFTRNQILFQAGTSVLASANLIPQAVLSLLQ